MATMSDRRKSVRQGWNLPVKLCKNGLRLVFEGMSINVSQRGAFIKTKNWQCFQVRDRARVTCYLPPYITGQNDTIGLHGAAVIRRVDQVNEAVAVEFVKSFNQFKPVLKT